ncbi:MAG: hypothetical protein HY042_12400, partial [Spirochaetia bacterium]|nr:hypothetical protein [Spirochaetia bacterium]
LFLQLQFPQALGVAADPERLNRIRSTLLGRAAAIGEHYGGREWTRKNDGSFFGFVGERFLQSVVAAMEIHSMVSVFNVTAQNVGDRIGVNIGIAAGNTVYRANKGDIYSEALNLSAHMAMSNGRFHGIMITQDVLDSLTPRARKYFFRSEKFEQHAVYHYEIVS